MIYNDYRRVYIDKKATFEDWFSAKPFNEMSKYIGKLDNLTVRKWYKWHDEKIHEQIDQSLPMEEKAREAFELRNMYRTQARELMADTEERARLDNERPNKTFEELIADKMQRKGMTRAEAIADIYKTAKKSNKTVNKKFGLE